MSNLGLPVNQCLLRHAHGEHDWWYTSSGGGHMIDGPDDREKNVKQHHCPGLGDPVRDPVVAKIVAKLFPTEPDVVTMGAPLSGESFVIQYRSQGSNWLDWGGGHRKMRSEDATRTRLAILRADYTDTDWRLVKRVRVVTEEVVG